MQKLVLRNDINSKTLYAHAANTKDVNFCRRLLAVAELLDTGNRKIADKLAGISNRRFTIWLNKFNEHGIDGLQSAENKGGRPPKMSPEIANDLREKMLVGPDKNDDLVRYRIIDMQKFIAEKHGISYSSSGMWYNLQTLNLRWKTGRQVSPRSDPTIQERFKKTLLA